MSVGFHPLGLFGYLLLGLALLAFDYTWLRRTPEDLVAPAIAVGLLMAVQYILDRMYVDEEYLMLTTAPPVCPSLSRRLGRKWPVLALLITLPFWGALRPIGFFFVYTLFWYPWQKRMYLRSHEEFGQGCLAGGRDDHRVHGSD
jgi:hypothetical protein